MLKFLKLLFVIIFLYQCSSYERSKKIHFAQCSNQSTPSLENINSSKIYNYKKEFLSKWIHPKNTEIKAIIIVVHGLNLAPDKMDPLSKSLVSQGAKVLRTSLSGHKGSKEEEENVSRDRWLADINEHYCLAKNEADKREVPLFAIGYSLGALLTIDFMQNSKMKIDRLILLAPAIETYWYAKLPGVISTLTTSFSLPSLNLKTYRAESSTSLAAYKAMKQSQKAVNKTALKSELNVPTLILMDKKDELISFKKTSEFMSTVNLDQWNLKEIDASKPNLKKSYRHLIIDEDTLGPHEWKVLQALIHEHFFL